MTSTLRICVKGYISKGSLRLLPDNENNSGGMITNLEPIRQDFPTTHGKHPNITFAGVLKRNHLGKMTTRWAAQMQRRTDLSKIDWLRSHPFYRDNTFLNRHCPILSKQLGHTEVTQLEDQTSISNTMKGASTELNPPPSQAQAWQLERCALQDRDECSSFWRGTRAPMIFASNMWGRVWNDKHTVRNWADSGNNGWIVRRKHRTKFASKDYCSPWGTREALRAPSVPTQLTEVTTTIMKILFLHPMSWEMRW